MTVEPTWMARAQAMAWQPPAVAREPLCAGEHECGSIEPALGRRLASAGLPIVRHDRRWQVLGEVDASFAALARWLYGHGLTSHWRDEPLAVVDTGDRLVGRIERAAVRPLGIATRAVHLVGATPRGNVWIQQRAFDKAVDPGRWDTLMGGLVSADESTEAALERETWEEAGLRLDQLRAVANIGRRTVRRPVPDGYMVEHMAMFEAVVPEGVAPANQDREVERFDCVSPEVLVERLAAGAFTVEAALVLLDWLRHRGVVPR